MAIVFYVMNYATKVEDPVWKRVVAAAELFRDLDKSMTERQVETVETADSCRRGDDIQNRTWQFLMRIVNWIFTERPLLQVEVIAHLLGYDTEFTNNDVWTFLNVSALYWHVF